uniref:Uncharacterized protein n=1 Tax=Rhabditophanes sp. KR3021 TaxID=114890 RepID=A0AC35U3X9_9BILA
MFHVLDNVRKIEEAEGIARTLSTLQSFSSAFYYGKSDSAMNRGSNQHRRIRHQYTSLGKNLPLMTLKTSTLWESSLKVN